jgi:hypothetical protein
MCTCTWQRFAFSHIPYSSRSSIAGKIDHYSSVAIMEVELQHVFPRRWRSPLLRRSLLRDCFLLVLTRVLTGPPFARSDQTADLLSAVDCHHVSGSPIIRQAI